MSKLSRKKSYFLLDKSKLRSVDVREQIVFIGSKIEGLEIFISQCTKRKALEQMSLNEVVQKSKVIQIAVPRDKEMEFYSKTRSFLNGRFFKDIPYGFKKFSELAPIPFIKNNLPKGVK